MKNVEPRATLTVESSSAEETEAFGHTIGRAAESNLVIALIGDLGAGKTTLTRGMVAGLGIGSRVTSPTFTLVNEYEDAATPNRLIHVDIYRLGEDAATALDEISTVGIDDLLDEISEDDDAGFTLLVIEWAERIVSVLPGDRLEIRLEHTEPPAAGETPALGQRRRITLSAWGANSAALMEELRRYAIDRPPSARVAQWMTSTPYTCTADLSLADAREMMVEYRCRRLPVVDDRDQLIGIVSLGDLRQAAPSSITSLSLFEVNYFWTKLRVAEAMTPDPVTVGPDDTLKTACERMLVHKVSGLPVVVGRKVVGILTESDILRFVVSLPWSEANT